MCRLQNTMYRLQHTMFSVQNTMYNVQCSVFKNLVKMCLKEQHLSDTVYLVALTTGV